MSNAFTASRHRWIYAGIVVALVALAVAGLVVFHQAEQDKQATEKAQQLAGKLEAAGLPAPDPKLISGALGTDGGPVCQDPAGALTQGLWRLRMSNGAAGPGMRPVLQDRDVVHAEALVLEVYCPDQLTEIQDKIGQLKLENTVKY